MNLDKIFNRWYQHWCRSHNRTYHNKFCDFIEHENDKDDEYYDSLRGVINRRKELGVSMDSISSALGISRQTCWNVESGHSGRRNNLYIFSVSYLLGEYEKWLFAHNLQVL